MSKLTPLRSFAFWRARSHPAGKRATRERLSRACRQCVSGVSAAAESCHMGLLNKFGSARHRYRWHGEGHVPGEFLGHQRSCEFHRLLPGDSARVRGHRRRWRAGCFGTIPDTVIIGLPLEWPEEFVVLVLYMSFFLASYFQGFSPQSDAGRASNPDAFALSAGDCSRVNRGAAGLLAA